METIEKLKNGILHSAGFKLSLIGFLTILLLIPANMILSLIREREQRRLETIGEITTVWGHEQTLTGPLLTIPFEEITATGKDTYTANIRYAHFLPENLTIEGIVTPEVRYRGIYKVITYRTVLHVSGQFSAVDPGSLNIPAASIKLQQAWLEIGIPDMRGINSDIRMHWGDSVQNVVPGMINSDISASGIHAVVHLLPGTAYNFTFDLDLNGSQSLNFVPLGKETQVTLTSPWDSPSFKGAFLPDRRKIDENGFQAYWHVLQLNRNFPQQWVNDQYSVAESSFGVELFTPVDTYQKSERSVKYAILFIALTFIVFFFAEVLTKTRIHAIYYLLTGIALCIFYSLLTALAEHLAFSYAYLIASLTIISMIGILARSLFRKWQVTGTVILSLTALYVFLFVILQLMDYSLLFGNVGLVVILGIVMYFSRKIDWYSPVKEPGSEN